MSCEPTSSQQVILPATDPNEKNTKKERKESWGGGGECTKQPDEAFSSLDYNRTDSS